MTAKEKLIHDQGLVSVLKQLHDDLDAAVFAAYGWDDLAGTHSTASPSSLRPSRDAVERVPTRAEIDQIILKRLVALNAERAAEEARGIIHWLRPEYQARVQKAETRSQKEMDLPVGKTKPKARKTPHSAIRAPKLNWPKTLAERVKAIDTALHAAAGPVTGAHLTKQFLRAKVEDVEEILETLCTMGHAQHDKKAGTYHP